MVYVFILMSGLILEKEFFAMEMNRLGIASNQVRRNFIKDIRG